MSMMDGIAASAMSMSALQLQQSYSLAVTKKAMDSQELAAQQLLEMLPSPPPEPGTHIDVYA